MVADASTSLSTANVVETCDPVMQRIPLALRQEYEAAWDAYGATCRLSCSSAAARREAYGRARECEERFAAALKKAQAEHNREKVKRMRKATSAP